MLVFKICGIFNIEHNTSYIILLTLLISNSNQLFLIQVNTIECTNLFPYVKQYLLYVVQVIWLGMYSYVYHANKSHNRSIQSLYTLCTDFNFSHQRWQRAGRPAGRAGPENPGPRAFRAETGLKLFYLRVLCATENSNFC